MELRSTLPLGFSGFWTEGYWSLSEFAQASGVWSKRDEIG